MPLCVCFEMCKPYNYTESVLLSETFSCVFLDSAFGQICYTHYNQYFLSFDDHFLHVWLNYTFVSLDNRIFDIDSFLLGYIMHCLTVSRDQYLVLHIDVCKRETKLSANFILSCVCYLTYNFQIKEISITGTFCL